ncbi:MAG: hypothetical protein ACOYXR_07390 [Nitrospirota bacterium]
MADALSPALRELVSDSLECERQLGRVYRLHMLEATGPRVRRSWEEGVTLKQAHAAALTPLLVSGDRVSESAHAAPAPIPPAREALSWAYDQERRLELQYREGARLAEDPSTHAVLIRLEADQRQWLDRIRATYRDYSAA